MPSSSDLCLIDTNSVGSYTITLNRPDKHHALNVALCNDLSLACKHAFESDAVKVIVIRSQGPVFCAGLDLKEMAATPDTLVTALKGLIQVFRERNKPILVEMTGDAYGGGLILVGMADLVLAKSGCQLSMPELKSGLWPFLLTPILMPVWPGHILNHSLNVAPMTAEKAHEHGWFLGVYDTASLSSATNALAQTLVERFCPAMVTGLKQYWATRLAHLTISELDQLGQCLIAAASERLKA